MNSLRLEKDMDKLTLGTPSCTPGVRRLETQIGVCLKAGNNRGIGTCSSIQEERNDHRSDVSVNGLAFNIHNETTL